MFGPLHAVPEAQFIAARWVRIPPVGRLETHGLRITAPQPAGLDCRRHGPSYPHNPPDKLIHGESMLAKTCKGAPWDCSVQQPTP